MWMKYGAPMESTLAERSSTAVICSSRVGQLSLIRESKELWGAITSFSIRPSGTGWSSH